MISCFFHHRAIRRHLDEGESLSNSAKRHIEQCANCRDMLATHSSIVKGLAETPSQIGPPVFLHTRVMNSLRETPIASRRGQKFQWAAATCAIALITIGITVLPLKRPVEPAGTWPALDAPIALKTSLPENPLKSEIDNLREDTLNAAKALAATFLPAADDSE